MSPPQVTDGHIVLREWAPALGLREKTLVFSSLDELYTLCLTTDAPQVIDRLSIQGVDEHNRPRTVTFVFQSITVSALTASG